MSYVNVAALIPINSTQLCQFQQNRMDGNMLLHEGQETYLTCADVHQQRPISVTEFQESNSSPAAPIQRDT